MSIEQRRATQLKRKKISKLQKIVKNKAAEFKRKGDILTHLRFLINGAGQLGVTESSLIKSIQSLGLGFISSREIRDILSRDVVSGVFTFTLPENFSSINSGTYKANTEGLGRPTIPGEGRLP